MLIEVDRIIVYTSQKGCDLIIFHTNRPCPFIPGETPLKMGCYASKNTGVDYVRETFGIEPEIVELV